MATLKLSNSSAGGYSRALRAIGRDLAERFPENLEIDVIGISYKVTFDARAPASNNVKQGKTRVLQKLFSKPATPAAELTRAENERVAAEVRIYKPETIDAINATQTPSRKSAGGNPDIYALAERLRTIGRVVELNHGKLLRVAKGAQSISFQYADSDGQVHNQELSNQDLFRLQQEYYAKRRSGGDVWDRDAR